MELTELEKKLQIKFRNLTLLKNALVHRSYLNEKQEEDLNSNERLEFLGDSVLSLVTSQYLYQKYPNDPEGVLTNYRSSLVKTQTLANVAKTLGLGRFLFLSKGEEESGGRENLSLLADTLEAVIGAIYLDQGFLSCRNFISLFLLPLLPKIIQKGEYRDYKSLFQEYLQAQGKTSPLYKVLQTLGPEHAKTFTIGVYCQKENLGEGKGHSKQIAQQEAAKAALEKFGLLR